MQFTLQSFKPITGYFAVGFGNSMKSAEVYVIAGRRSATGRREPQFIEEAQADFSLVPSLTKVGSEQTIITFERDMTVQSIPDVSATFKEDEKLTSMIWAVGNLGFSSDDPSNSIPIHQRDNKGQVSVNLFDKVNSPYIEGSSPRSGNLEGQGEGSSSSSTLIIMHGVFMFLAWCVFAPTGIFVARFFKDILGENWFKLHIGLMLGGGSLLSVVALIIAVVATGGIDVSDMEALGTSHVVLGLIVIIVSIAQVVSGFVIDKLFDPARNKIPWWDKV
ncbi:hypothetical protein HK099_001542 [Clydaea vesicula]|uniref:Cytochrome b561 domain-containing protein n=1 Tax=Clydaea vesicula TaxID=447962 RepID=A0AAD5TU59_9FUNG|nr:hypothetical protein HK099_001542 [Clydaea vesicula]